MVFLGLCAQWFPAGEPYRLWSKGNARTATSENGLLDESEQREGSSLLKTDTRFRPDPGAVPPSPRAAKGIIAQPPREVEAVEAAVSPALIDDPESSLDPFYQALARTAERTPGAMTRVVYFGDSIVASDYITGTLRRALQSEFGEGGHGFVLMADAWPSYFHNDVYRLSTRGFEVSRVVGPFARDGLYGLGGVSFVAATGVRARFGTVDKGDYGRRVSRFELAYLEYPGGGQLALLVDGVVQQRVSTDGPVARTRHLELTVTDGPHELEVLTQSGQTRTFGVVMERDKPGVVLDAIGIQGARIRSLSKEDEDHWSGELRQRDPNLVVFQFGANESADGFAYPMSEYHASMAAVLRRAKRAVPGAACLVVGAMDQGKKEGGVVTTRPIIVHLVREQAEVAREVGCAFWNTYEAMGGYGAMAMWVKRGLGQADMIHPSGWGAQVLGNWLFGALMYGYDTYLHERDPRHPAPEPLPAKVTVPPPTNDIPPLKQRE